MGKNLLTVEEKVDFVIWYLELSAKKLQNKFLKIKLKFETKYQKVCPNKSSILSNVKNYRIYGSVENSQ